MKIIYLPSNTATTPTDRPIDREDDDDEEYEEEEDGDKSFLEIFFLPIYDKYGLKRVEASIANQFER